MRGRSRDQQQKNKQPSSLCALTQTSLAESKACGTAQSLVTPTAEARHIRATAGQQTQLLTQAGCSQTGRGKWVLTSLEAPHVIKLNLDWKEEVALLFTLYMRNKQGQLYEGCSR